MSKIIPAWNAGLPAELEFPVGHLRKEFLKRHFKNGSITEQICFEILHFEGPVKSCPWRRDALREIESAVSAEAVARFNSRVEGGTLSSVVAAFFDLYVESMNPLSVDIFHKLLAIAVAKQQHINSPPVAWAKAQTEDLIEWKGYLVRAWVRNVCDSREADLESYTGPEWPEWEAPKFLIMEPLGEITSPVAQQEPFNSDTAQERLDAINTKFTLRYFENRYTQKLRIALRHVAGEAAVHMAMHGVPPPFAPIREPELAKIPEDANGRKTAVQSKVAPKNTRHNKRSEKIREINQLGEKGIKYCKTMDDRRVPPLPEWIEQGWPGTYVSAYNSPKHSDKKKWRKKIQTDKSRNR